MKIQSLLIASTLALVLFACRKSSSESSNTPSNSDLQTQSDDESRVSNETDAAFNDVNVAMSSQATVTGSVGRSIRYGVAVTGGNNDTVKSYICDAVVTIDTVDATNNITIHYNGSNCQLTRTRVGTIVVSWNKGARWSTPGAVVTVQFNNLKITRIADGKSITLNGTHTYTNVSGGSLVSLASNPGTTITHTITSNNMAITFDNGMQRTWSFARKRVFTYNSGYIVTTTGMHTDGTTTGISEWGTNRFGDAFTVQITQGLTIQQSCSWQLTSGALAVVNARGTMNISFGLDKNGQATSCPVNGAVYYFQLSWTGAAGKTYTFILPY